MALYEALYGRSFHSPIYWNEVGNRRHLGPYYIQETIDKVAIIYENLITAQSRQKSYANNPRRSLEFIIGDHVFLKVLPYKGKVRFGKKCKLSP